MSDDVGKMVADGYDDVADAYAALESAGDPWPRMRRLNAFIANLEPRSRVLDLGCGNGVPATRELAARHVVTAVDISPEQAARARRNAPGPRCCAPTSAASASRTRASMRSWLST